MQINFCVKEGSLQTGVIKSETIPRIIEVAPFVLPAGPEFHFTPTKRIFVVAAATASLLTPYFFVPDAVFASSGTGNAFDNMYQAVMTGFDSGVVLVIIFSGACWALGHRPKALEILIGCCCGYLVARHARDIRDFLKEI